MKLIPTLAISALLAAPVAAQACSDLTVTGDGSPGSTLTFDVSGTLADAPTVILVSPNAGSTTLGAGPLTIQLDLDMPIIPIAMERSDANGAVSTSVDVPPGGFPQIDLHAQALSLDFAINQGPPTLDSCTPDVEMFQVGSSSS